MLKCDHIKRLITLTSDNIKRLSLYSRSIFTTVRSSLFTLFCSVCNRRTCSLFLLSHFSLFHSIYLIFHRSRRILLLLNYFSLLLILFLSFFHWPKGSKEIIKLVQENRKRKKSHVFISTHFINDLDNVGMVLADLPDFRLETNCASNTAALKVLLTSKGVQSDLNLIISLFFTKVEPKSPIHRLSFCQWEGGVGGSMAPKKNFDVL